MPILNIPINILYLYIVSLIYKEMAKRESTDNPFADDKSLDNQPSIPLYDRESEKADITNKEKYEIVNPLPSDRPESTVILDN